MRGIFAALLLLSVPATAQTEALDADLLPVFDAVDHVDNLPDLLNCAGLYRSLAFVLETDETSELAQGFRDREGYMAGVGGMLWVAAEVPEGGDTEGVFDVLLPPIDAATEIYLLHMDATAAATDAPFDEAIFGRLDFCNAIFEALQEPAG
ncbi:hypothetical protein [Hasllibacter sp. MH4015]|uniref:hypothetical protein n=1 Tax=Hasllibacter sp. MH4015 TaxID=2854029 RepID=UPI001CD38186|nr:hypothetical protein [Hasllibacter sp. MH4015]